jgi:tetratricopeptide (TPR) repeat protein
VGHALLVKNEFAASLESYRKALALREAVVAADPANVSARSYVARAHSSIGDILAETGDSAGAVESYRKALSIREAMAAGDPGSVDLRIVLADSYADLALLHSRLAKGERTPAQNRPEQLREARSWFQRSLDIFNELQSKGKLTGDDARKPENLSRELAKIEEALGKGGKK